MATPSRFSVGVIRGVARDSRLHEQNLLSINWFMGPESEQHLTMVGSRSAVQAILRGSQMSLGSRRTKPIKRLRNGAMVPFVSPAHRATSSRLCWRMPVPPAYVGRRRVG